MFKRPRFSLRTLLIAVTLLCVYLGMWSLTASWGVRDVTESTASNFPEESTRLDHDPNRVTSSNWTDPPWHFVGNGSSPCPFVVGVDYGSQVGHLAGTCERIYFFWFFGFKHHISGLGELYWLS